MSFIRPGRDVAAAPPPAPPAPPPAGVGLTPDSPVFLRTTATNGQIALAFSKPRFMGDGSAIAGDPVTSTYIYRFGTEAAARLGSEGSPSQTTDCGTASTGTLAGVSAGTYWVSAECENSGGISYASQPIEVVVT